MVILLILYVMVLTLCPSWLTDSLCMWMPIFINWLPNLWLATCFMLCPLSYSGVHDTMSLNLYTFVQMLHCWCGVYNCSMSTPSSAEEGGWVGTQLWDIKPLILNTPLWQKQSLDELLLLFTIILINYIN